MRSRFMASCSVIINLPQRNTEIVSNDINFSHRIILIVIIEKIELNIGHYALIKFWPGGNQRFTSVGIGEFLEIFDEQPAKMARPLFPFASIVIA